MPQATQRQLEQVGDALEMAWRNDLNRVRERPRRLSGRRRLVLALALGAGILGGGAAIAAGVLKTTQEEERGILEGHVLFAGSDPTCTALSSTSFRCTLERPPTGMTFYEGPKGSTEYDEKTWTPAEDLLLGAKMQTVDSTSHIDGGCVSTRADGREWHCYLGQEAVRRGIIGPDLLGAYQPGPASG
jgi:hypothetical protein